MGCRIEGTIGCSITALAGSAAEGSKGREQMKRAEGRGGALADEVVPTRNLSCRFRKLGECEGCTSYQTKGMQAM